MTCADVEPLISAYVDGELDLDRSIALEAHVAGCAACTQRIAGFRSLSAALRTAPYFTAPMGLEASVRAVAERAGGRTLTDRRGVSRWLAVAAGIGLLVAGAGSALYRGAMISSEGTAQAVVASHVRSLMAEHLTDVTSTDRHTVKPWFAGRLDFSPVVVNLASDGFPLAGGRLDYIDGHPAAALVYRRGGHVINVIVWPVAGSDAAVRRSSDPRGYQLLTWTRHRTAWWVVSDLAAPDLAAFASKLRDEVGQAGG